MYEQTYKGIYEIIVVDSSVDSTPELVKTHFKDVKYIHLNQKTDPGTARNIGIKKSKGDLLLMIDSDCQANNNWIESIVELHEKTNFAAIGGSVQNGNDPRSTVAWAGYLAEFREFIPQHKARKVKHIPTCNISYKRKTFTDIGFFNPLYYPQEDLEFNHRIISRGDEILFDPRISVKHHHRTEVLSFFSHQQRVGRITAKMLKILPVEGSSIARSKLKSIVLIPFLPMVKFVRTVLLFSKLNNSLLRNHPFAIFVFALGLLPWACGFIRGVFQKEK